jgi:hypothetical protein
MTVLLTWSRVDREVLPEIRRALERAFPPPDPPMVKGGYLCREDPLTCPGHVMPWGSCAPRRVGPPRPHRSRVPMAA